MLRSRSMMGVVAGATAFVMLGTGCFGSFTLTRKVYDFNKGVGDKWMQSIVAWAFCIIPVYGFAVTVDFLILNLVEFWTGTNPVTYGPGQSRDLEVEGMTLRMTRVDTSTVQMGRLIDGQLLDVVLVKMDAELGQVEVSSPDGSLLATAREIGGGVVVENAEGQILRAFSPEQVAPVVALTMGTSPESPAMCVASAE